MMLELLVFRQEPNEVEDQRHIRRDGQLSRQRARSRRSCLQGYALDYLLRMLGGLLLM